MGLEPEQSFDVQESYRQQLHQKMAEHIQQEVPITQQNNLRSSIAAGKALVPIIESKWHKLSYILCNFETILEHRKRVKPNNSPVFLYPNGKIRIPVMGTYTTINEAYKALKRLNGDTSQETLPTRPNYLTLPTRSSP